MKFWIIVGAVLLLLWLFSLLRVGVQVRYGPDGFFLAALVGLHAVQILPARPQKKEKKPRKKKQKPAQKPKGKNLGFKKESLSLVRRALPLLTESAGRFRRKIRIDEIEMDLLLAGAEDPAGAGFGYGGVNAAINALWPQVERAFYVKRYALRTNVDFQLQKSVVKLSARLTMTIGQCVVLGVTLGYKAIKLYLTYRREQKQKEGL